MGSDSDRNPAPAQVLNLPQVLRHRLLPEARQASASVRREQDDDADPCLFCSVHRRYGLLEPEVVELADGGVTRSTQLPVDVHVLTTNEVGRLALRLGEHQLTPAPEVRSS